MDDHRSLPSLLAVLMVQAGRLPRDTFALRLRLLRHDLRMTTEAVARGCGLAQPTWSTWERGVLPRNQAAVAKQIADATGYDVMWLLYGGPLGGKLGPAGRAT